ncbi:branched-chain amino acid ABC transporter permease [Streptacidiphilus rugosus]|uniref:branched-chain amino acid ABC transporter permease n=1 Tax=Streptacidiphilus rugosus TaxID=405783 RepID=UPI0005635AB9|nr:branched-chain amino acid ABC transporter permease [Streptacidiphilus rugosus]
MTDLPLTAEATYGLTKDTARPLLPLPATAARALTAVGGLLTAGSAFLAWTYSSDFPDNLTVNGYPAGLQWVTLAAGLLTTLFAIAAFRPSGMRWLSPSGDADAAGFILAIGAFCTTWYTLLTISFELGGLANLTTGGLIAGGAALVTLVGGLALPRGTAGDSSVTGQLALKVVGAAAGLGVLGVISIPVGTGLDGLCWIVAGLVLLALVLMIVANYAGQAVTPRPLRRLPGVVEILLIVAILAVGLVVFMYGIDTSSGELFTGFMIAFCFALWGLRYTGLLTRMGELFARQRAALAIGTFVAAAVFPLTQTSDVNATIGVNLLIFGTTALGLNVVVGMAGLLDLGYVAFLGVGAYTAALVSGAATSALHVTFPFWAAALTGAAVSGIFGVILGAPTLRVRGDYLAIVTLGFGEIFRIVVGNLDGVSGPNLTGGPNGIVNIPDLNIFGFDFGASHSVLGVSLGRFSNYFELMLLVTALVVLIFSRASDSRIGRAWIAIREDEIAASAMGINGFRFKLLAFALGATLAGLAGTVMAHVTLSVVPDPFQFAGSVPPNSAFLLAAVVIGGMGTVPGPFVGAMLFYVLQSKLQFLQSHQLLVFGAALILFMRFRPEGIIASKRQQLEFHEAETEPSAAHLSTAGA